MSQGADGGEIDAGLSYSADIFKGNAPRGFEQCPTVAQLDDTAYVVNVHVVQHNDIGAGIERLARLVYVLHLDLDLKGTGSVSPRFLHRSPKPCPLGVESSKVIVFDQNAIAEALPVIIATADSDRIFLQRS